VSPSSYTPRHLADKILTSRNAVEGERKLVTVLFVDVSGFTSLSEHLDPEDVHRLMNQAFEIMIVEVHHHEGTVNQFLGDGIMALFGAPIAHEDHAQRAASAALGIQKRLTQFGTDLSKCDIRFQVRQGLNTGSNPVGATTAVLRGTSPAMSRSIARVPRNLSLSSRNEPRNASLHNGIKPDP
jgi:class 3 adenylate cyclase